MHGRQIMQVNIHIEGTVQRFTVPKEATVFDLKAQIQEEFKYYPAVNQRLSYNGEVLNDFSKLESYEIGNGANIDFRYRIVVHGRPDRRGDVPMYELFVEDDNTVADLKHTLKIEHGVFDIYAAGVNLKMGNRKLDDGAKLSDYDIRPGSNIRIV